MEERLFIGFHDQAIAGDFGKKYLGPMDTSSLEVTKRQETNADLAFYK